MKVVLFANTDWYLFNFRLELAREIRRIGGNVVLLSPFGPFGQRLLDDGFTWIPLKMGRRSLNPWSELQVVRRLTALYRREKPDLVHHFTIKPVVYGSVAARIAKVPGIVNAVTGLGHVFVGESLATWMLRPIVQRLLRTVVTCEGCRLILQNPDDKALFEKRRLCDAAKIRLIRGSGVNVDRFRPASRRTNSRGNSIRVLLATRLLWEKGVREFIDAAEDITQSRGDIEFVVAGTSDEGNPAAVPEAKVIEWQKNGLINYLGYVEDMVSLLQDVQMVVLPSYREGTPRILLEAASSGLPIIATDVPGCREVVEHKVNGLLVPPRNTGALAEAIAQIADDPSLRAIMGEKGRQKMRSHFAEHCVIGKTLDVYQELIPLSAR